MNFSITDYKGCQIAEVIADEIVIKSVQDALDLMADCGYQGAIGMIIREEQISPDFFDLQTRLAGEILQKFSNYRMKLAIIGDFSKYPGNSLRDFIYESNKSGRIFFVASIEEARNKLVP
jgi:hypothetical protein